MNRIAFALMLSLLLAGCGEPHGPPAEQEVGPHGGRMLRDGDFALEVTIFETNVPPQYRLFAYHGDEPLAPERVEATIRLTRLDGEVDQFTFVPGNGYLQGSGEVVEPHSFDVEVDARHADNTHRWNYAAYEGRTLIPAETAREAGVKTAIAGPAILRDTLRLMGAVVIDANRHAAVRARFPGVVRSVSVQEGQRVRRGETLVAIEGNDSMRVYALVAPFDGIVLKRNTNVGDVAGGEPLIEMADLSTVWIELRALGADAARLRVGQPVDITSATGGAVATGHIQTLLPLASGQSVVARASIANPEGQWRPGTAVTSEVVVSTREVPLAVKEEGLQRFRDFTVVFAQVGDTYEVRMLTLGDRDGRHAEVLGGLKPGTAYVTEQSFLIKADVEKSGASHDH